MTTTPTILVSVKRDKHEKERDIERAEERGALKMVFHNPLLGLMATKKCKTRIRRLALSFLFAPLKVELQ